LPRRTVAHLSGIDSNLARAIVSVTERSLARESKRPPVEIVDVSPGTSVLTVSASRVLREIPWLRPIEIDPGRFLLTVIPGTTIESLEGTIASLLDRLTEADDDRERRILIELGNTIRTLRESDTLRTMELSLVCVPAWNVGRP